MPKSQFRYKHMDRRGGTCSDIIDFQSNLTSRNLLLSIPPRKVSFEDSRKDSNPSIRSEDTVPTKSNKIKPASETFESEQEKRRPIRSKRSLLVRPTTSLSLVDLAKSVSHNVVSLGINGQFDVDKIEERNSKRVCSPNLSPRSVVHTPDFPEGNMQILSSFQSSSDEESKSMRSSPWGHFIDMAPDEDNYLNLPISAYPNYAATLETNQRGVSRRLRKVSRCRTRRRLSPYGECKSYTIREAKPTLCFVGLRMDTKLMRNFRLSPRSKDRNHRSADELIGVFSELQVQHGEHKTI